VGTGGNAYFSDRGRLIQADRGRRIGVAVAALGERIGTGVTVSYWSTISLKRSAVVLVLGMVDPGFMFPSLQAPARAPQAPPLTISRMDFVALSTIL
jgi:hypothetical protein